MVRMEKDEYGRMLPITHSSRYFFEHKLIPGFLYQDGIEFMGAIVSKDNVLNDIFLDIMKKEGVENPYGENPIKVEPFKVENILVACIVFPEPEVDPLCYRSYLFYDIESQKAAYYCVERGEEGKPPFLCGWNKEGVHLNYGNHPDNEENLIVKMFHIFVNPEGDDSPKVVAAYAPKNIEETD